MVPWVKAGHAGVSVVSCAGTSSNGTVNHTEQINSANHWASSEYDGRTARFLARFADGSTGGACCDAGYAGGGDRGKYDVDAELEGK